MCHTGDISSCTLFKIVRLFKVPFVWVCTSRIMFRNLQQRETATKKLIPGSGRQTKHLQFWVPFGLNIHTKIRILQSNVLNLLLYGSECWKTSFVIEKKHGIFQKNLFDEHSLRFSSPTANALKWRTTQLNKDVNHFRNYPNKMLVLVWTCPAHASQHAFYGHSVMDTPGKKVQRPTQRKLEANRSEGPEEPRSDNRLSASSSCRQNKIRDPIQSPQAPDGAGRTEWGRDNAQFRVHGKYL